MLICLLFHFICADIPVYNYQYNQKAVQQQQKKAFIHFRNRLFKLFYFGSVKKVLFLAGLRRKKELYQSKDGKWKMLSK